LIFESLSKYISDRGESIDHFVTQFIGEDEKSETSSEADSDAIHAHGTFDVLGSIQTVETRPVVTNLLQPRRRRKRDIAKPYVLKGIMSGFIYMLGEAIACGLFYKHGKYGFHPQEFLHYSVLHSTLIGALANGPMLQLFFEWVDWLVTTKSRLGSIVSKVIIDQIVWGCLWNFSYILLMNIATDSPGFGYIGEGLGIERGPVRLLRGINSAFWKAINPRLHLHLLAEGLKMLPMDIICYALVPLSLWPVWVAAVDVFWVAVLSQFD